MSLPSDAQVTAIATRLPSKDRVDTRRSQAVTADDGSQLKIAAEYTDFVICVEIGDHGAPSCATWYPVSGDSTRVEGITPARLANVRAKASGLARPDTADASKNKATPDR